MNFEICFDHPWLLLLLIPAALFTFIPYFRIKKRYRRTRNRIISLVLHSIVMVLSIALLSGFYVRYYEPNNENEMIVLVDVSDTGALSATKRDAFVETVIDECSYEHVRVGVVTFGFDQVYAAPLTYNYDDAFDAYMDALQTRMPDTSATNLAGALEYAKDLFNYPKTAKIVVITDGKETDGKALSTLTDITSKGISVDVAYLPSNYSDVDAQILNVLMPEQHVELGKDCEIGVVIRSDETMENVTLKLLDNDNVVNEAEGVKTITLTQDEQTIYFKHSFDDEGLHEIKFQLVLEDGRTMNNVYCAYYNMQLFNKILIVESEAETSNDLISMLNEKSEYEMTPICIFSSDMPLTVDGLREYDQVILNNVGYDDMPDGFEYTMKQYVEVYGGGVLTLGGNDAAGNAHAYDKKEMYGTAYQSMLPIQVDTYTPPIGVMFVLDASGSMMQGNDHGGTYFYSARQGVIAGLDVLYDRDYVGIMTLDTYQSMILEMTPRTQETKITEAISNLACDGGSTVFSNALRTAGESLRALKEVSKRHVIIISDGITDGADTYLPIVKDFYDTDKITFSVIGVNMTDSSREAMKTLTATGNGRLYEARSTSDFVNSVQDDLLIPTVKEKNDEPFSPIIYDATSPLVQGLARGEGADRNRLTVTLGGLYGGKVKKDADLILMGEYEVPVYAQWKLGAGTVGSFMCDLQATTWSASFMSDVNGKTFIRSVVNNLMPMSDISPNDITVKLTEDNYTNTMSVFPKLKEGETVKGEIVRKTENGEQVVSLNEVSTDTTGAFYTKQALGADNRFSHCEFVVKESGVYEIRLAKYDQYGEKIGNTFVVYKTFSYSEEYDETLLLPEDERIEMMMNVTTKGNGSFIEDLEDMDSVMKGYVTELERVFDPRFSFMIAAIVIFLLDVAVCKFKFKWIHEIIRDNKRKKELQ